MIKFTILIKSENGKCIIAKDVEDKDVTPSEEDKAYFINTIIMLSLDLLNKMSDKSTTYSFETSTDLYKEIKKKLRLDL